MITPKPIPTYTVELSCYPPFKAEPVVWKISDVYSLDDEKIKRAYESLRRQYPKSPIRMRSPLGNKTFYENSTSEYQLKVYDKESGRVDTFSAGTLPQAMSMCEELWNANPDSYKNIEVIHNNNVVTSYNGLEEGFTMNLNAAQQQPQSVENPEEQNEDLAKYDAYDSEFDAMKNELGTRGKAAVDAGLKAYDKQTERDKRDTELELEREKETKRKSYTDNGGQSFASKLLNNNVTKNLAAAGLTGLTGGAIAPMFAKGITDHGIDMINNYNKETQRIDKAEKDFDQRAEKNKKSDKAEDERIKNRKDFEKKLTGKYSSSVGYRRQDDIEKQAKARAVQAAATKAAKDAYTKKAKALSTSKAQEFNQKAKETMRGAASRKKSESLNEAELEHSWVNQRKDIANIDEFIELAKNGIHPVLADARRPKWHNIFAEKQSDKYVEVENQPLEIMVVLDGVEEIKHPKTGEPIKVAVIKEKIPTGINQESGSVTYKDGERHRITFNQFKKLINDPVNAEILQKFEKANPDDPELMLELYNQAKENMDEMYPEWEKSYWDEYKLGNYSATERANIYLRWKEVLKDTAYQDGHEMTAEEVNKEFGIPKIQKNLKELGSFGAKLDQQAIDSLIKQLPVDKADELLDKLGSTLEDCYELDLNDTEKRVGEFMSTAPAELACENIINKMTNNMLRDLESNISNSKKDSFEALKSKLLNDYIKKVNIHGSVRAIVDPKITSYKNKIQNTLNDLAKRFDVSKWRIDVNEIRKNVDELKRKHLNPVREIKKSNDEYMSDFGKTDQDFMDWQSNNIASNKMLGFADKDGKVLDPTQNEYTIKDVESVQKYLAKMNRYNKIPQELEKAKNEYEIAKNKFDKTFGNNRIDNALYNRAIALKASLIDYNKTFEIDDRFINNGKLDTDKILEFINQTKQSRTMPLKYDYTVNDIENLQAMLDLYKAKEKYENLDYDKRNLNVSDIRSDIVSKNPNAGKWIDKAIEGKIKIVDNVEYKYIPNEASYVSFLKTQNKPKNDEKNNITNNEITWENIVNNNMFYNKNDADNGIGILDRIDRSLKAYKDVDTKGIRISSKYRKLLDNMLDQLKAEYPEGNEEELGDVIKSWYNDILKPELSKETSVNKKLQNYIVGD